MQADRLADLEVLIGHSFRDKSYLINALSHSSTKTTCRPSNERLEFLGDSVLGLIISDALYRRFSDADEGTLTRIKSQAVSRATLQRIAAAMGLDRYIMVGKGVAKREIPASLIGNLYEAIVGALYLDSGLSAARKFILRNVDVVIEEIVEDRAERNYKSMLQHHCQKDLGSVPIYRVRRESGPAHGRQFEVGVQVNGTEYGVARAESKKEAEQGAARAAIIHFGVTDETVNTAVRGAGTLLRSGPDGAARRGGQSKGRGDRPESGPEQRTRSQRRRRGGRGRRSRGEAASTPSSAPASGANPVAGAAPPASQPSTPSPASPASRPSTSAPRTGTEPPRSGRAAPGPVAGKEPAAARRNVTKAKTARRKVAATKATPRKKAATTRRSAAKKPARKKPATARKKKQANDAGNQGAKAADS